MATMKRAEERERERRIQMARTYFLILSWQRVDTGWRVNFLDNRSRLPVTYQRIYKLPATIRGFVERSLTNMSSGPRVALFMRQLENGKGEIEIEVTSEQYIGLLRKPTRDYLA